MKDKHDDITAFYDQDIYIPSRTLYMGSVSAEDEQESGVDFQMAQRLIKGIHILTEADPKKPITILMNNTGGDEYHGMAIYDAIRNTPCKVTVKVYGHAMSMGAVILQAADRRLMSENARVMIHYGTWGVNDHPKITYNWADEGKKFDKWMKDLFLRRIREKHPKYSKDELEKALNFDTFYDAKQALRLGFIDAIVPDKKHK